MADANGKSLPQNERIRGHVLQILARQNALSMSLSELGVVLKKATGPFTGKLKSILQHFPADFTVSKKGNVFLLRKEESSEGAIAPPGVTRQLRVGSHEGASTSTPQPHTDISAAAILGEPVMPLNKAKVPVSNRTEPLWLPRDVEVAGPFPSKKVLKLLLKAQKAAAAVGASAEATQMPPISQNGVALQTTQSVSQVPTATQSGVASQTIRPVTAPSDHSKCMITTEDHLSASLDRIAQHSVIALDCEGCNLSRTGRVCLIQVAIPSNPTEVFLFDLVDMSLGARQLVKHGLGTILADPQITKVIHDCRQDSDALYHQLGIRLEGVFDTQAAYVELMKERKAKVRGASGYVPLPGLNKLLKEYAGRENEAKQGGKVLMEQVSRRSSSLHIWGSGTSEKGEETEIPMQCLRSLPHAWNLLS